MLFHYPTVPAPDTQFDLRTGAEMRDLIKTCASNDIPFRLRYQHSGKFRYFSDACWTSR